VAALAGQAYRVATRTVQFYKSLPSFDIFLLTGKDGAGAQQAPNSSYSNPESKYRIAHLLLAVFASRAPTSTTIANILHSHEYDALILMILQHRDAAPVRA
jgi:hypothetical protein